MNTIRMIDPITNQHYRANIEVQRINNDIKSLAMFGGIKDLVIQQVNDDNLSMHFDTYA